MNRSLICLPGPWEGGKGGKVGHRGQCISPAAPSPSSAALCRVSRTYLQRLPRTRSLASSLPRQPWERSRRGPAQSALSERRPWTDVPLLLPRVTSARPHPSMQPGGSCAAGGQLRGWEEVILNLDFYPLLQATLVACCASSGFCMKQGAMACSTKHS